jgi:hypothetical protein
VTVVDKNKAVVCCLLDTSERKEKKRKEKKRKEKKRKESVKCGVRSGI